MLDSLVHYKKGSKYSFKIRSQIVAPKDHVLIQWDLKQAESWVVAYLANEPRMKKALQIGDIHRLTAAVVFEHETVRHISVEMLDDPAFWESLKAGITPIMRYVGKQQNHAKAYREGYIRAAEIINRQSNRPPFITVTIKQSKRYHDLWHEFYNLKPWWDEIDYVAGTTRTLITPYGRIRTFFAHYGNELFKKMTAHVPQSTVSDHAKGVVQDELGIAGGIKEIDRIFVVERGLIRIINESHDSFIAEVHKDVKDDVIQPITTLFRRPLVVRDEMFTIPVEVQVGERWGELEEISV